jgi:RNA polymerase sigma factor (sigma-70 family)
MSTVRAAGSIYGGPRGWISRGGYPVARGWLTDRRKFMDIRTTVSVVTVPRRVTPNRWSVVFALLFAKLARSLPNTGLGNVEVIEIYSQYGHMMRRRCLMILRDPSAADDALQNALIKVMRYGKSLLTADSKLRWLYRVCDRACFDLLDKKKRRAEVPEAPLDAVSVIGPHVEARDTALALLRSLDEINRKIVIHYFLEGMSQQEVADELNLSRQSIHKRMVKIKKQLQVAGGRDD